jgi:hypothetical protein
MAKALVQGPSPSELVLNPANEKFRTPSVETLRELIDSRYTVYDVLPSFFNYSDNWITLGMSDKRGYKGLVS